MKLILFYITNGSEQSAHQLGRMAVEQQLAACANIFPIQSIFPWEGALQTENEFVLVLKTMPDMKDRLHDYIAQNHPYDIPCIINFEVEVNEVYGEWIKDFVSRPNAGGT